MKVESQGVKKQFLWEMGDKKDRIEEMHSIEFNFKKKNFLKKCILLLVLGVVSQVFGQ